MHQENGRLCRMAWLVVGVMVLAGGVGRGAEDLEKAIESLREAGTRVEAIRRIGQMGPAGAKAAGAVAEAMRAGAELRREGLAALVQIKAAGEIAKLMKEDRGELLAGAVAALVQLRAREELVGVLREGSAEAGKCAGAGLVQLRASGELAKVMREGRPGAQGIAISCLIELNGITELIQAVADSNPELRQAAVKGLIEMKAFARLIEAMRDDADYRQTAIATLSQMKVAPQLLEAMRDSSPDVRNAATWELTQLKAVPELLAAAGDETSEVRQSAVEALLQLKAMSGLLDAMRADAGMRGRVIGTLVRMKATAELAQVMGDSSADTRAAAAGALVQLEAAMDLCQIVSAGNEEARRLAVASLLKLQALPRLIDAMSADERTCRNAVAALVDLRATAELAQTLKEATGAQTRKAVVGALAQLGAAAELAGAMSSADGEVREAASAALAKQRKGMLEELNGAMRHIDADVRKDAAASLLALGAIHDLVHAAADANADVRKAALAALARGKALSAMSDLLRENAAVRASILETLTQMNDAAALADILRDSNPELRAAAAGALVQLKATAHLLSVLSDSHQEVRDAAIVALVQLKASSELLQAIRSYNPALREAGISALAQIGEEAIGVVVEAIKAKADDRRQIVRPAAAAALGRMDPGRCASLLPTLVNLLRNEDEQVRETAGLALSRIGRPAIATLLGLLRDADPRARNAASSALAQAGAEAMGALLELLGSEDGEMRAIAARTLARAGRPALGPLIEIVRKRDPRSFTAAVGAIGGMGWRGKDGLGALILALLENAGGDRAAVANAIIQVGARPGDGEIAAMAGQAMGPLVQLLLDKASSTQQAACIALASFGPAGKAALERLHGLVKETGTDAEVVAAGLAAIGHIGGAEEMNGALSAAMAERIVAAARAKSAALRRGFVGEWPFGQQGLEGILCALASNAKVQQANVEILTYTDDGAVNGDIYAGTANVGSLNHLLVRTLCLFHAKSPHFPGRLEAEVERRLKAHYWRYLQYRGRPLPADDALKAGFSDLIENTTCYLALSVLKDDPEFAGRRFPDGGSCQNRFEGWNGYFQEYLKVRAVNGLWHEPGSSSSSARAYAGILNLHDLSPDAVVRQRARMFLDLAFIEEEQVSLGGARGGYKGNSVRGVSSNIDQIKDVLAGQAPRRHMEPCEGLTGVLWTSGYQLPPAAILLRKIGVMGEAVVANRFLGAGTNYAFRTPSYVMGCHLYQPGGAAGPESGWAGLLFDDNSAVYFPSAGERWYVQHRNVQISQRLGKSAAQVAFSSGIRRVERGGWIFAQVGPSYAAVRICGDYGWTAAEGADVATLKDAEAAVILHAGDVREFGSFERFQQVVLGGEVKVEGRVVAYKAGGGSAMEFFTAAKEGEARGMPTVGGQVVDPYSGNVYAGPSMQSMEGGKVRVRFGARGVVYDLEGGRVGE